MTNFKKVLFLFKIVHGLALVWLIDFYFHALAETFS